MSYCDSFSAYFSREVAEKAAQSLSNGAEIEIRVGDEAFTFTREAKKNLVVSSAAKDPQVIFILTPKAADLILTNESDEIGSIGVQIAKLLVSSDDKCRAKIQLKAGFLTLFGKGYFGVVTAGGAQFASFLASKGLGGMGAIKTLLAKLRG